MPTVPVGLVFYRGDVSYLAVKTCRVVPVDPFDDGNSSFALVR